MTTTLPTYLATIPGRCPDGFASAQHPRLCSCRESTSPSEWVIFTSALRKAAKSGRVHQGDVRPLIRGRIEPRHIGRCYSRARREGLLVEVGREQSNDVAGRNTNKWEPVYELRSAA